MEKLMYLAWKKSGQTPENFRDHFIHTTIKLLQQQGAGKVRLTVMDSDVSPAAKLKLVSAHQAIPPGPPDAVISFWLDTAIHRRAIEKVLLESCSDINGYLVTESEPLLNTKYPAVNGARTHGMNQVVFLQKPPRLTREQWIELWHNSHTRIAIDTQSTFGYRQNVVVRTLTEKALTIDAIVEENFPDAAMTSSHAFYNAVGDDALLRKNRAEMYASVQRFVDFDKIDCLPMSEYNF